MKWRKIRPQTQLKLFLAQQHRFSPLPALQSAHYLAATRLILKELWQEFPASKKVKPRGIFVGSTA